MNPKAVQYPGPESQAIIEGQSTSQTQPEAKGPY